MVGCNRHRVAGQLFIERNFLTMAENVTASHANSTQSETDLVRRTLEIEIQGLDHVLAFVDENYKHAVDLIRGAKGKVVLVGVG